MNEEEELVILTELAEIENSTVEDIGLLIGRAQEAASQFEFNLNENRYNPFDLRAILYFIKNNVVSVLNSNPIEDLQGAIAHAVNLCKQWSEIDRLAILAEEHRIRNAQRQQKFRDRLKSAVAAANPKLAALQKELEEALAGRRKCKAEWDARIVKLRGQIHNITFGHNGE